MEPEPTSQLLPYLLQIDANYISGFTFSLIFIAILLVFSGIISASEVAFFSLSKRDLQKSRAKNSRIKTIIKLLEQPKLLLATILILNNTINIALVLFASFSLNNYLEINNYPLKFLDEVYIIPINTLVNVVVITFLLLLFGEIIPKVYASRNTLKVSMFTANFLNTSIKICKPLSLPLMSISKFLDKRMKKKSKLSVDQLSQALQLAQADEDTSKEEQRMLEGIVNFGNTEIKQIMTPRVDVFALEKETSFSDVIKSVSENGFSRIPIYNKQIDSIVGVLYAKDLLPILTKENYNWLNLLRPTFFVPENRKLDNLLQDFRTKKIHLALVVDEYGGTSGVISLEDVMEEIVGDISDEFDDEDLSYSKLDNDNFVLDGKTSLKDFYKIMNVEESLFEENKKESDTLAGFVLEINEDLPKRREKIFFKNFIFQIESITQKRIKTIKVTRLNNDVKKN